MMSRLLDRAIAELLGHKLVKPGTEVFGILLPENDFFKQESETAYRRVPNYCEDGNAMLELSREMRARGWLLRLYAYMGYFSANFFGVTEDMRYIRNNAKADALPEAVALAAYKALTGGKEWSE